MRIRALGVALAALCLLVLLPRPADAQQGRARQVQLNYMVVYASNDKQGIDARLRPIEDSLKVLKFSGFEVLSDEETPLSTGQTGSFDLPGQRKLEVTLSEVDDRRARLQVRMMDGGRPTATTNLTIGRNGTFLYGGVRHKAGRLVVPIRVRY